MESDSGQFKHLLRENRDTCFVKMSGKGETPDIMKDRNQISPCHLGSRSRLPRVTATSFHFGKNQNSWRESNWLSLGPVPTFGQGREGLLA